MVSNIGKIGRNEYAVLSHPIDLMVILIISTVIITFFCFSIQNLIENTHLHQVEHEVSMILTEATNMYEYATEGSMVTLQVNFPVSMHFIVFGALPMNGTNEPINRTLDETTNNNYYFAMDDGTVRTFHCSARFSGENLTQIAVFYPGSYDITMKLCNNGGKTYVTMYEKHECLC
jgi:hypothetical protein